MKKTKRLWALLLAMVMALGLISTAFAAPTIDSGRKASLSLYKYDITAASEDGAWNTASYVSTGVQDDAVTDKLAQYAIQGVEFTYLRVADIAMNNELVDGQRQVGVLYGFAEGMEKNCPPFWRPSRSRVFIPPMSCGNFSGTCLLRMRSLETSTGITATGVSSWMRRSSRQSWRRSMTAVPACTRSLIWNG